MSEEAKVQESQVFNFAEPGQEPDLRDAWGRSADADEAVEFRQSEYMNMKVNGPGGLKEELERREAAGREFDKGSIKTKRDLVAALEADDAKAIEEAKAAGQGDGDDDNPPE